MSDPGAAGQQWDGPQARRAEYLRQLLHDLRGGLSVIRLGAVLLRAEFQEDELIETVEDIISTTENLNQVLNELRDLVRPEAGREPLDIASFDAAELLRGACDSMRPIALEKGLALVSEGETPLPVQGDRAKVQRIAQNLILNALTYAQEGRVELGWSAGPPGRWGIHVRDTGSGMPPSGARPLVRGLEDKGDDDPPSRPDQSGASRQPASRLAEGIGLVIAHRLCQLLDGVIDVETEPGRGTVFHITLPAEY